MSVYDLDHSLPQLPIPELVESCDELKKRIRPLVDEQAFAEFTLALEKFCAPDGQGALLQQALKKWQGLLPNNNSWLRPFWDDAYLTARASLPVSFNYVIELKSQKKSVLSQFIVALLNCLNLLRKEALPVEMARSPLSMDTLTSLIYTRIPARIRDILYNPPLSAPMTAAVSAHGHWFILSLTDQNGHICTPPALQRGLDEIKRQAALLPPALPVSVITCLERACATTRRDELSAHLINRINLNSIENALFVICLDENLSEQDFSKALLAGAAPSRWYDKSLQIISSDKQIGLNLEHSGCDGSLWAYMLSQIDQQMPLSDRDEKADGAERPHFRQLEWVIPDALAEKLKASSDDFSRFRESVLLSRHKIPSLNRAAIKSCRCSPDAFIQILLQYAYYQQTGKFRSFYEAVSVRNFYQGRTENIRTCTDQSVAFIQALEAGCELEKLRDAFYKASCAHGEEISRSKRALGCERHMTGLRAMHQCHFPHTPEPALFSTAGFKALTSDVMSTSSVSGPSIEHFFFAPVASDGIGVGYGLSSEALHLAVTAYGASGIHPERFVAQVEATGRRLIEILTAEE